MYKVVIVDDESIIVQGLKKVIPWKNHNCEVVGVAYDTASAINVIRKHSPDILFTDVRMPDGNGLTMLAGLRSEHPLMQVTVLTGYKEFDYAQQAINLGVARFLLKPSKMDELEEALRAMTENLDKLNGVADPESGDVQINSFVVREATKYIKEHYHEKTNLSDVADACYVSQWHLSKLLSKTVGSSFYDILNKARIDEAKVLLEDVSLRIGEISEMVGYSDASHFSRIFKKVEGMSPNEFRNLEYRG